MWHSTVPLDEALAQTVSAEAASLLPYGAGNRSAFWLLWEQEEWSVFPTPSPPLILLASHTCWGSGIHLSGKQSFTLICTNWNARGQRVTTQTKSNILYKSSTKATSPSVREAVLSLNKKWAEPLWNSNYKNQLFSSVRELHGHCQLTFTAAYKWQWLLHS